MPKLLLFAPCQKAIIDEVDKSVSLVGVMHGFNFQAIGEPPSATLPTNVVIPMNWAMVSIWLRLPEDNDKTFEQLIELITPDNTKVQASTQAFQMTTRTHQIAMSANTFPVGKTGEYKLVLSLREIEQTPWVQILEYPIVVHYLENQVQKAGN